MLYSAARFFVEGIRLDSAMNVGGIHIAQIISVLIFLFAMAFMFYLLYKKKRTLFN